MLKSRGWRYGHSHILKNVGMFFWVLRKCVDIFVGGGNIKNWEIKQKYGKFSRGIFFQSDQGEFEL